MTDQLMTVEVDRHGNVKIRVVVGTTVTSRKIVSIPGTSAVIRSGSDGVEVHLMNRGESLAEVNRFRSNNAASSTADKENLS